MTGAGNAEAYGPHLAHLGKTGNQLLSDHLSGVAAQCSKLAEKLGLGKAGELIGLLHDLGKATNTFQDYLLSFSSDGEGHDDLRGKIDHSTAGAQCLLANIQDAQQEDSLQGVVARLMAICIASHHSGLIDCLEPDGSDKLTQRLEKQDNRTRLSEAWTNVDSSVKDRAAALMRDPGLVAEVRNAMARLTASFDKGEGDKDVQMGLLLRLLFSCLIDADRTNTANFEKPAAALHRQNLEYETWEKLVERLDRHLSLMNTHGSVNVIRRQISDECFRAADRLGGIYSLLVPTGGGKTLSALRFALEHARRRALDRIIFVSPYISIVDQNAAVARSILEPEGIPYASVVLEHHSNVQDDPNDEVGRPDLWRRRVLAENWDAPVVFTTSVQVLEALFGSGTRAVRRLHAMARAVIVFDEVQTLPIKMVHLFNNAINLLASHCGSTVVLCTATQPLLDTVSRAKGALRLGNPPGLISNPLQLFERLKRYEVFDHTDRPEGWQIAHVAELALTEAQRYGSCLAIVNTKKDAREIFQNLREQAGANALVVHLSTGMCPAHRVEKLEELCAQLPNATGDQPVICVSTQLIEAGVDIDFASVIRDLAGLDSIAQAAGRCNRHGARPTLGRVHIVELPEPPVQLDEIRQGRTVARELLGQWRRANPGKLYPLDDPQQMTEYYDRTFYRRRDEMSYRVGPEGIGRRTSLLELLGANGQAKQDAMKPSHKLHRSLLLQSFQTANNAFALIANTQGIIVPYNDEGRGIVNQLAASFDLESDWNLLRKAQRFTLSVYASQFTKLSNKDAVYEIHRGSGVYCLRSEFYDSAFGLREQAGPLEDLIA
ncbi:MAG: CRISPR-associated helicase Cas3' [Acidobacteriaceae bacterium]|nr:CRISPR-associated helicase Cas3' [Acidobacteriaceae bacterium]